MNVYQSIKFKSLSFVHILGFTISDLEFQIHHGDWAWDFTGSCKIFITPCFQIDEN